MRPSSPHLFATTGRQTIGLPWCLQCCGTPGRDRESYFGSSDPRWRRTGWFSTNTKPKRLQAKNHLPQSRGKIAINMAEKLGAHVFHDARVQSWNKDTFLGKDEANGEGMQPGHRIVAYSFRHAYATRALSRGVSITILAELMGRRL